MGGGTATLQGIDFNAQRNDARVKVGRFTAAVLKLAKTKGEAIGLVEGMRQLGEPAGAPCRCGDGG